MSETPEKSARETVQAAVLGISDSARYLGMSRRTLERILDAREMAVVQISPGRRGVTRDELDGYIARRTQPAQPKRTA